LVGHCLLLLLLLLIVCLSPAAGKGKEGELELLGEEEEEEEEEGREQPKMGAYSVAEVIVYPVKACRGISVSSAAISATGNNNNYRCFHSPKKQFVFSTILQTVLDHSRPPSTASNCLLLLLENDFALAFVVGGVFFWGSGFLYDREWMVVNADNGRLIAMARAPKLALVQPSLPAAAFKGDLLPDDAVLGMSSNSSTTLLWPAAATSQVPQRHRETDRDRDGEKFVCDFVGPSNIHLLWFSAMIL
jgi:hypothetical protein